ncbi:hypothetical protein HDU83_002576 [Entophlyctis luteolus]|nr:hypothetical protein HDU83_002576 [Entophlyctis luteolus]
MVLAVVTALILGLLVATAYVGDLSESLPAKLPKAAEFLHSASSDLSQPGYADEPSDNKLTIDQPSNNQAEPKPTYDHGTEKGSGGIGKHLRVKPSPPTPKSVAIPGCQYPIFIHVTPDVHSTGVLALYGSIMRNTLNQPDAPAKKTCVHVSFVDPALNSIEEMYQWTPRENPYKSVADCAALDSTCHDPNSPNSLPSPPWNRKT